MDRPAVLTTAEWNADPLTAIGCTQRCSVLIGLTAVLKGVGENKVIHMIHER